MLVTELNDRDIAAMKAYLEEFQTTRALRKGPGVHKDKESRKAILLFVDFVISKLPCLKDRYEHNLLGGYEFFLDANAMVTEVAKRVFDYLFNGRTHVMVCGSEKIFVKIDLVPLEDELHSTMASARVFNINIIFAFSIRYCDTVAG